MMYLVLFQAISGENLNQSEQLPWLLFFHLLFPHWQEPFHRVLHYLNLSSTCSKQAFDCINVSNISFCIASQSVRIYISFGRSTYPSKILKLFRLVKTTLTHTPFHAFIEIAWLDNMGKFSFTLAETLTTLAL